MIRHLEDRDETDRYGATYIAPFSVFSGEVLSRQLAEFCTELAELFRKLSADRSAQSQVWMCIDRRDANVQPYDSFAIVSQRIRFDFLRPGALPEYHSIALSITILGPGDFDLLKPGWPSLREWLLGELLKSWRAAMLALADERLAGVLTRTRAWIHGQPGNVYGYDVAGKPGKIDYQLVGSEDAYALFSEEKDEDAEDEDEWEEEEEDDDEWKDDEKEEKR